MDITIAAAVLSVMQFHCLVASFLMFAIFQEEMVSRRLWDWSSAWQRQIWKRLPRSRKEN